MGGCVGAILVAFVGAYLALKRKKRAATDQTGDRSPQVECIHTQTAIKPSQTNNSCQRQSKRLACPPQSSWDCAGSCFKHNAARNLIA
jgi:hypothetical protein